MRNKQHIFAILFFSFFSTVSAQYEFYQLGGYVKYLYSNTNLPSAGRVNDHLFHSRINNRLFVTDGITAGLELRNRIFIGGSVEKTPDFLSTIKANYDIENVDIVWWNSHSSVGYSELDRFWLDITYKKFQLTAGRQRIAFGTSLVWNPTDLFNPLTILDFDYEERPGVDAIRLQYFNSEASKIEIVFKPGKTKSGNVIAAKILLNEWRYDFHILGGSRAHKPFIGFAWAGDIEGAGFRGELLTSQINDYAVHFYPSLKNKWSTTLSLSGDYTFPSTLYIHTELLYNDRGVTNNAAFALILMQSLNLLSPARWSIFQELSYDVHPLVHLSGFIILNPNDESLAFVPSATWSAIENFDVSFFGLLFSGGFMTEYGSYGRSIFVRGKYSF